jgi:hypothetical protein
MLIHNKAQYIYIYDVSPSCSHDLLSLLYVIIPRSVDNTAVKTNQNRGFTHLQIEWNPWIEGYCPQIPILSALCPQLNLLTPPHSEKILVMPLSSIGTNECPYFIQMLVRSSVWILISIGLEDLIILVFSMDTHLGLWNRLWTYYILKERKFCDTI